MEPLSTDALVAHLRAIDLFAGLEQADLRDIAADLNPVRLPAGQTLFRQGDATDALYIVISGRLQASTQLPDGSHKLLGYIQPGQPVGELALLSGGERGATVSTLDTSELVRFSAAALDRLTQQHPQALQQIGTTILRRLRSGKLIEMLPSIFGPLDLPAIQAIESEAEWVHLPRGGVLLRQGDVGGALYIVVSGRLYASVVDEDGGEKVVGEILSGESIGEMDMLSAGTRSASVYASRDSELVKFTTAGFDRLMDQYPQALRYITQVVIRRLRKQIQKHDQRQAAPTAIDVVLVPAAPGLPLPEFAQRLSAALAAMGSTLILTSALFDSALGKQGLAQAPEDDPRNIRLVAWLNEQESRHAFILYIVDPSLSPWTRRCLRQSDQLLVVGRAGENPAPGELEQALARLVAADERARIRQRLVLLHDDEGRLPSGTHEWLAPRRVELHHHVRWNRKEDFSRLARFIAGRAVGLALGGGGARGFAHIGVIRALDEAGLPIDIVGGTSMGSVIAAELALGWDIGRMIARNRHLADGVFNDVTLPLVSLLESGNYARNLRKFFGQVNIEDLWLPYYCVSTNVSRARIMVHRSGPVWRGVRASGGLPGVAPPVNLNGDLLVDGAVLDNLPMDVMRELCGQGTVIAVDVTPPVDLTGITPYGDALSGWWVLWRKLNRWGPPVNIPNLATLMQRTSELGSIYYLKDLIRQRVADLYLRPPVEKFDLFDFRPIARVAELGYQFAKEKIAAWDKAPVWKGG